MKTLIFLTIFFVTVNSYGIACFEFDPESNDIVYIKTKIVHLGECSNEDLENGLQNGYCELEGLAVGTIVKVCREPAQDLGLEIVSDSHSTRGVMLCYWNKYTKKEECFMNK